MTLIKQPRSHQKTSKAIGNWSDLNRWASGLDARITEILETLGILGRAVGKLTSGTPQNIVSPHGSQHLPNGSDPLTTLAPSGGYATTAAVGTGNAFLRNDARFKYPNSLMSDANSSLLTLTDGATSQTLTATLDLSLQLASGGSLTIKPDPTTATSAVVTVQVRPGAGNTSGLTTAMFSGNVTGSTISAWNANLPFGSAAYVGATLAAYRIQTISANLNASSDANNKLYGFLGASPLILSSNGGWLEVASAYFPGPSRSIGTPTISGTSAGLITEPPTIGATTQVGLLVQQRGAQITATNRYGVLVNQHNSGTNRWGFKSSDKIENDTTDFICGTAGKGLVNKDTQGTPEFWRTYVNSTGTTTGGGTYAVNNFGVLAVSRVGGAAGTVNIQIGDVGTAAPTS